MIVQYHEVKIVMEFRDANELVVGLLADGDRDTASQTTSIYDGGLSLTNAALWVDKNIVYKSIEQNSILVP